MMNVRREDRKTMSAQYALSQSRAQKKMISLLAGSATVVDHPEALSSFKESFALRTHMIKLNTNPQYVVGPFPSVEKCPLCKL